MASGSVTTSSDAIAKRFSTLKASGKRALVPYITAGHPDEANSLALLRGLGDAGADVIELGIPFSDPLADGPVIQASSEKALAGHMSFDRALELLERARASVPVVLLTAPRIM